MPPHLLLSSLTIVDWTRHDNSHFTRLTMGESRTELIQWLNDLLQVNYTKVEQCGTGGAYCQIIDSIFGEWNKV